MNVFGGGSRPKRPSRGMINAIFVRAHDWASLYVNGRLLRCQERELVERPSETENLRLRQSAPKRTPEIRGRRCLVLGMPSQSIRSSPTATSTYARCRTCELTSCDSCARR